MIARDMNIEKADARPDFFLVFLICFFLLSLQIFFRDKMLGDPDTLWHIAIGQEILKTGHIPQTDIYSHTLNGTPYISKDWLSEILLACAYNLLGFSGVFLITSLSVTLTFGLLASELSKKLSCTVVLILCFSTLILLGNHLLCRPHVLIFPLVLMWTIGLLRSAETATCPSIFLLLILFFWSNMHGSFILGILIMPLVLVERLLVSKKVTNSEIAQYCLFFSAALLVPLIGLNGLGPMIGIFKQFSLQDTVYFISEWHPQDFSQFNLFEIVLLGGIAASLILGIKVKPNRVIILILLIHMALSHKRHSDFLGLIAPLLLANPISEALEFKRCSFDTINKKRIVWKSIPIMFFLFMYVFFYDPPTPPHSITPKSAVQTAQSYPINEKVLNHYDFGGFLMFSGLKTFIDGRQDFYGADYVRKYSELMNSTNPKELEKLLDDNNITWTLLKPEDIAAKTLDRLSDWKKVYTDKDAVVHVKIGQR